MNMRIVGVPEFEIEFDWELVQAFTHVCRVHYSGDVKSLADTYSGFGGRVNGPITIAANKLNDGLHTGQTKTTIQVTIRQLDIMRKGLEVLSQVPVEYRDRLIAFRNESKKAINIASEAQQEWRIQL